MRPRSRTMLMQQERPVQEGDIEPPIIHSGEELESIIEDLREYIKWAISNTPLSFEELKLSPYASLLTGLANSFVIKNVNSLDILCDWKIVAALLILKWEFVSNQDDDWTINITRGHACEYVAWHVVMQICSDSAIECLLNALPLHSTASTTDYEYDSDSILEISSNSSDDLFPHEERPLDSWERTGKNSGKGSPKREGSPLLPGRTMSGMIFNSYGAFKSLIKNSNNKPCRNRCSIPSSSSFHGSIRSKGSHDRQANDSTSVWYNGLNALEIATIANAKKFLSRSCVQDVINDVWKGRVVLWNDMSLHAKKKPQRFNRSSFNIYSRLRVPVYHKMFEGLFFLSFLALYYAVLMERDPLRITQTEIWMSIWIAAFAIDTLGDIFDAGMTFYRMDFWNAWDVGIIGIGAAFLITRIVGLSKGDYYLIDTSFDILSLEALFLVPRMCSLMSLNAYFGIMIPVLSTMSKEFFRFLPILVILYSGFLTTFTMLARERLSITQASQVLVKIFFGATALGFDIASEISPVFGYPLILVFVCLSNILLISTVTNLMSLNLSEIMGHAREEYLFQLSIYVLECTNSSRLTYFIPPLNLFPLFVRPLRLFLVSEKVRRLRIIMLQITHLPFALLIWMYETIVFHYEGLRPDDEDEKYITPNMRQFSGLNGPQNTSLGLRAELGFSGQLNPPSLDTSSPAKKTLSRRATVTATAPTGATLRTVPEYSPILSDGDTKSTATSPITSSSGTTLLADEPEKIETTKVPASSRPRTQRGRSLQRSIAEACDKPQPQELGPPKANLQKQPRLEKEFPPAHLSPFDLQSSSSASSNDKLMKVILELKVQLEELGERFEKTTDFRKSHGDDGKGH